jgi:hypothetical protein
MAAPCTTPLKLASRALQRAPVYVGNGWPVELDAEGFMIGISPGDSIVSSIRWRSAKRSAGGAGQRSDASRSAAHFGSHIAA